MRKKDEPLSDYDIINGLCASKKLIPLEKEIEELKKENKNQDILINILKIAYFRKFLKVDNNCNFLTINLKLFREEFDSNIHESEFLTVISDILNSDLKNPHENLFI